MQTDYSHLFAEVLADVEAGVRHACRTTPECRLLGGCPKCGWAIMRGVTVGVERIEVVRRSGVVRLTIASDHGRQPCVVVFKGVEIVCE
jgi:hypothetical protein